MNLLLSVVISLAATLLIEMGLAFLLKVRGVGLIIAAAVNLLTNPVLVLIWNFFPSLLFPMELAAVLIEGCCYRLFPTHFKKPFLYSLLFNFISCTIGFIMNGGIL